MLHIVILQIALAALTGPRGGVKSGGGGRGRKETARATLLLLQPSFRS